MAKKSPAQKVRDYIKANPTATAEAVANKFGITKQYVYVLRSAMNKVKKVPVVAPEPVVASEPVTVVDMVNKPPHYTDGGMEVIDFIEAKQLGYHLGNVVKYVSRAGKKNDALEDLKKARWYLDRAIEQRTV